MDASQIPAAYVSAMEIRVLGPIEVLDSGERLDLGGRKQKTVLAMLVANAGRPVSTDRLIDAAYGDEAPDGARRSVQTYVSNLRSQMGDVITKAGAGYEFQPLDSTVDTVEFERLMQAAQTMAGEDPAGAASELREALALWRGHPFQDAEARSELDAEITRFNELRLVALESRVEADLAAGLDRELVGELEALTIEYPLRESFHSQYMLALYRSGRQAEALRAYTRMREYLADELGIDPSPELRRLEQRILEQDPTLVLTPASAVQRRAVLVVDLAAGVGESLGTPDERRQTLIELDRVVGNSITAANGALSAQQATATYGTFEDVRSAITAAGQISVDAPRTDGTPIVRIGVDVGDVEEEPSGLVSGPAVIRAAGLVAAANPGQVLLSSDAQAAAAADTAGGWVMRALGEHTIARLKEPETIHQLIVDGQPSQFPPLLTDVEPPELPAGRIGVPGYELREEIGRGVFGTVYRAYQPSVGREVAVKVINPELANDPAFIRRFAVEAQMISRIEHPNVVPLHDFWRDPGGALLVMRLMRGGNLADYAGVAGLDREALLRLVDQVGGALATAHSLGIAHGDVQASNVLLNESVDFFLGDFGVASTSTDPTERMAQELDTAAFAATVDHAAALLALSDAESELLDLARRGAFYTAGEFLSAWRAEIGAAEASPTYTPTRNPYKGLAAFSELDAQDFHGRDAATDELVAAIASKSLVAAVGPSGVGKSSVVRAGLLPALRSGAVAGSAEWLIADCTPGSHPFERLASALVRVASSLPHDLEDLLRSGDRGLIKAVDRFLPPDTQLLLIVDQFEELFTLTRDGADRDHFLDLLAASVSDASGKVRVLVTLRADFFDRPLRHPSFGELLRSGTVPISAPTDAEMRAIITNPAAGVGVTFESGLVEKMISEVHGEAGALPLVEFALTELFEQRDSDLVTLSAYEASGGVVAALGRRAEEVFSELDDHHRDAARQVFLRLVTPGLDGPDTRRRIRHRELERMGVDSGALDEVLAVFGKPRLLTFDHDEITRGATVEVAHEALIREWPRLKGWIDANREELVFRSRLAAAVTDWEQSGRSGSYLLTRGRLAQHESWTETTELTLSSGERELLETSRIAEDERASKRKRMRQLIMSGFAAAAVIALVLAAFALNARRDADDRRLAAEQAELTAEEQATLAQQERDRAETNAALAEANAAQAEQQRLIAEGRALVAAVPNVAEDDPQLALLLSLAASERLGDAPAATEALHASIAAERTIYEVPAIRGDISPDGRLLAVIVGDGNTIEVQDIQTRSVLWSHMVDVDTPSEYEVSAEFINQGSELLTSVAWLPAADKAFETPSDQVGFQVWDAPTGEFQREFASGPCGPFTYYLQPYGYHDDASDSMLVIGTISDDWYDANGCRGWDAAPAIDIVRVDTDAGQQVPIYSGWDSSIFGVEVAMTADGSRAVLGTFMSEEGGLTVIDVDSGEVTHRIAIPEFRAGVGVSPDGSLAHSYGVDGDMRFFDIESGQVLFESEVPDTSAELTGWWYTGDGTQVYVPYFDGVVRVFDTADGSLIEEVPPIDGVPFFTKVTSDNDRMAVFDGGMARVSTIGPRGSGEVASFTPCGTRNADAFYLNRGLSVNDNLITIYARCGDSEDTRLLFTYDRASGELVRSHQAAGQRFAVGDDGVAAMQTWRDATDGPTRAGALSFVDLRTGDVVETLPDLCEWDLDVFYETLSFDCLGAGLPIENTDLVVSADRNIVAIASFDFPGDAYAWNRETGEFAVLRNPMHVLSVSPDGSLLAAAMPIDLEDRSDGSLVVYSTEDFSVLTETSTADDPFGSNGIDFTPDGASIVGITDGGVLRFHDSATLEQSQVFAPHEIGARDVSFSADGAQMATVGLDGFARVWDMQTLTLRHEISIGGIPTAVDFVENDAQLVVTTRHGGVSVFHLDLDALSDAARKRLRRGFTEDECRVYFPDGGCPTLEEVATE